MGIFDGLSGISSSLKNLAKSTTNQVTNSAISSANSVVQQALNAALGGVSFAGGTGGLVNGGGGTTSELAYQKSILELAMAIQYAQGWQFVVEADGMSDLFMYVRDVTYSDGAIETEAKVIGGIQFNKPTHISAGTVTLTVRDSQDGKIAQWFDQRKSLVINRDGTINLSPVYTMSLRIYRVSFEGVKTLDRELTVFPTERGSTSRAYDQLGECHSYSLTFVSHSSADTSLMGMATSIAAGVAGDAVNSSSSKVTNLIKF